MTPAKCSLQFCRFVCSGAGKRGGCLTTGRSIRGGDSNHVRDQLVQVREIQSTARAFAALKEDPTRVRTRGPLKASRTRTAWSRKSTPRFLSRSCKRKGPGTLKDWLPQTACTLLFYSQFEGGGFHLLVPSKSAHIFRTLFSKSSFGEKPHGFFQVHMTKCGQLLSKLLSALVSLDLSASSGGFWVPELEDETQK